MSLQLVSAYSAIQLFFEMDDSGQNAPMVVEKAFKKKCRGISCFFAHVFTSADTSKGGDCFLLGYTEVNLGLRSALWWVETPFGLHGG